MQISKYTLCVIIYESYVKLLRPISWISGLVHSNNIISEIVMSLKADNEILKNDNIILKDDVRKLKKQYYELLENTDGWYVKYSA